MGIGKIVISKRKDGGRPWQNEYPFQVDFTNEKPNDTDLIQIGAGIAYDDDTTDPNDWGPLAQVPLIAKLLAFERRIHFAAGITITNVYVTDGVKQAKASAGQPNTSVFWSANLNLPCTRGAGVITADEIAPGNVTLLAKRSPLGFSARQGKVFYRGCLTDADVRFNGDDKVDWTSASQQAAADLFFQSQLTLCGLRDYFGDDGYTGSAPFDGLIIIGIGRARGGESTAVGSNKSDLVDIVPMSGMVAAEVTGRQARRGRRRKVTS